MSSKQTILTEEEQKKKQGAAATAAPAAGQTAAGALVKDYSDLIRAEHAAAEESALAGLEQSYRSNLDKLTAAEQAVPAAYQESRNRAAGEAARAQRNFDLTAAANGLGAGTGAQARLARGVALQNELGKADREQAAALAELNQQRVEAEREYGAAVNKAKSENARALSDALYRERVRVDEATAERERDERDYNFSREQYADKKAQQDWENNFAQTEYTDKKAQQDWENAFAQTEYADKKAQQKWENDFAQTEYADKKAQQDWENAFAQTEYTDKKAQQKWENDFAQTEYADKKAQQKWENTYAENEQVYEQAQQKWENDFAQTEYADKKVQQKWENTYAENEQVYEKAYNDRKLALEEQKYGVEPGSGDAGGNTDRANNIIVGIINGGNTANAESIIYSYAQNIGLTAAELTYLLNYFKRFNG